MPTYRGIYKGIKKYVNLWTVYAKLYDLIEDNVVVKSQFRKQKRFTEQILHYHHVWSQSCKSKRREAKADLKFKTDYRLQSLEILCKELELDLHISTTAGAAETVFGIENNLNTDT